MRYPAIRFVPLVLSCLIMALIGGDMLFNNRSLDVMASLILVVLVMSGASVAALVKSSDTTVSGFAVAPIDLSYRAPVYLVGLAILLVMLVPRIGIPALGFAVAKYRRATALQALLVAAGSGCLVEGVVFAGLAPALPHLWD